MRLEAIEIGRFKHVEDFRVDLDDLTVLVGPNNSGKTTLLQAMYLLSEFITDIFQTRDGDPPSLQRWEGGARQPFDHPHYRLGYRTHGELWPRLRVSGELDMRGIYAGGLEMEMRILTDSAGALAMRHDGEAVQPPGPTGLADWLEGICKHRAMYVSPVGAILGHERRLPWNEVRRALRTGRSGEVWRNVLWWAFSDNTGAHTQIRQWVSGFLPGVQVLPPRESKAEDARVLIEYDEGEDQFDVALAGGGLRTLLAVATMAFAAPERLLLFDEPLSNLDAKL
ncbi:MAG: AAA family ATPase, partial [Armatimonadota bacterium]